MLVPAEASLYCGCWPRLEVDYGTIVLWHDKYGTIVLWIPSQHEFEIRQVVHKQVLEFESHALAMRLVVIRDSCGHRKWWLCGAKRPKKTNIIVLQCHSLTPGMFLYTNCMCFAWSAHEFYVHQAIHNLVSKVIFFKNIVKIVWWWHRSLNKGCWLSLCWSKGHLNESMIPGIRWSNRNSTWKCGLW